MGCVIFLNGDGVIRYLKLSYFWAAFVSWHHTDTYYFLFFILNLESLIPIFCINLKTQTRKHCFSRSFILLIKEGNIIDNYWWVLFYVFEIGVSPPVGIKMFSLETCSNKTLNDPWDSKENSERHFRNTTFRDHLDGIFFSVKTILKLYNIITTLK